jgi:hypothetical protein
MHYQDASAESSVSVVPENAGEFAPAACRPRHTDGPLVSFIDKTRSRFYDLYRRA